MHILYPADVLKPKKPDGMYADEAAALREAGFGISVISLENLVSGASTLSSPPSAGERVIYRGWMLSGDEYQAICNAIEAQDGVPLTSRAQYLLAHYLPNGYPALREFTPETAIFKAEENLEAKLIELGWGRFFIKDFVKSLKTSVGSIIEHPNEITTVMTEMKKFRGKIEGGICVRRVEPLLPETERRFFVIGGRPHGPDPREPVPKIVQICATRIQNPFFSVDLAMRADGVERIVEIGDGQVSDLVGWDPRHFAALWHGSFA